MNPATNTSDSQTVSMPWSTVPLSQDLNTSITVSTTDRALPIATTLHQAKAASLAVSKD